MKKLSVFEKIPIIFTLILIILLSALLAVYGLKGTYSRYAQDDYCYGYRVQKYGFLDMQINTYLNKTEFNSDRYSLTLAHSVVELSGGPRIVPILPSMEIIGWIAALSFSIWGLLQIITSKTNYLLALFAALSLIFFTLLVIPSQYQILFWLSAMQTYFTPVVLATFLFGLLIVLAKSAKLNLIPLTGLGLLAILAGGFSETTGLWQFACWSLILGWSLIYRKNLPLAKNAIRPALVLVGGAAVSLIIMFLCPATFKRVALPHSDFITLIRQSFIYGADFLWNAVKSAPVLYFVIYLSGFFASLVSGLKTGLLLKNTILKMLAILILLYGFSVVVMVPALYVTSFYPGDRSLFPAQFALSICLFLLGWKSVDLLSAIHFFTLNPKTIVIFQGLIGILLCFYVARTFPRVLDKLPAYQARANAWDLRQSMILEEKQSGITKVVAPAFDSVYGVTELHLEPTNWVNSCAAKYYGVKTITTVDGYAGFSAYPIGK